MKDQLYSIRRAYRPNIEKLVLRILEEHNLVALREIGDVFKQNENNFSSFCLSPDGSKSFIKICLIDPLKEARPQVLLGYRMANEVFVYSLLNEEEKDFITPVMISGSETIPQWILLKEFPAKSLYSHASQFDKNSLRNFKLDELFKGVKSYQNFSLKNNQYGKLPKFDHEKTVFWFEKYTGFAESSLGSSVYRNIYSLLCDEHIKNIWNSKCLYLAHGDLGINNMGFHQGKLALIDWENAQINHPLFDLAKLYVQLWIDSDLQKRYISEIKSHYESQDLQSLFWISVIIRSVAEVRNLHLASNSESRSYSIFLKEAFSRDKQLKLFECATQWHVQNIQQILSMNLC